MRTQSTRRANGIKPNGRGSWKAQWGDIGGKRNYYRSGWELNYAKYLEFLKSKGDIFEWEHEPHAFWFEGIKRGTVSYLPDFRVTLLDGSFEYHEVKGWMDSRSKTCIKRMAKYHPEVVLKVIDKNVYVTLSRFARINVPGWDSHLVSC